MTIEQVQQEVRRFWNAFLANDARTLANFYCDHATTFNATGRDPEPGPLDAARCYFDFDFSLTVEVGEIKVQIPGPGAAVAVASYTLRLHRDLAPDATAFGDDLIEYGRVSQVFAENSDGRLCIVHEHLSLPEVRHREQFAELIQVPA